jgi:hypothetical protein
MSAKRVLCEEHCGYALTLEVIATLAMASMMITLCLFIVRVMNVQRYMNTVMTSTAADAARWGGNFTKAYRMNVSSVPLHKVAKDQLDYVAPDFFTQEDDGISVTPDFISYDDEPIVVTIQYSLPPGVFDTTMSRVNSVSGKSVNLYTKLQRMQMRVKVYSIMNGGKLLG